MRKKNWYLVVLAAWFVIAAPTVSVATHLADSTIFGPTSPSEGSVVTYTGTAVINSDATSMFSGAHFGEIGTASCCGSDPNSTFTLSASGIASGSTTTSPVPHSSSVSDSLSLFLPNNGTLFLSISGGSVVVENGHGTGEFTSFGAGISIAVQNVAPQNFEVQQRNASVGSSYTTGSLQIFEGQTIQRFGQASDPGAGNDPLTFTIDGQSAGTNSANTQGLRSSNSVFHTYVSDTNGSFVNPGTNVVSDGDGGVTNHFGPAFRVLNEAPSIVSVSQNGSNSNITVQEGSTVALQMISNDPGADTQTFVINGNSAGTGSASPGSNRTSNVINQAFNQDGTFFNNYTVFDDDDSTTVNRTLVVTNVAPTILSATQNGTNGNITVNEGSTVALQMQSTDPGADAQTFDINGNSAGVGGTIPGSTRTSNVLNQAFNQNGTFTNTFTVADDDTSTSTSHNITVLNVAPIVVSATQNGNNGNISVTEGSTVALQMSVTDPGMDVINFTIDGSAAGNASGLDTPGSTRTSNIINRTYNDDATITNGFSAFDGDDTTTVTRQVTVTNVLPTLTDFQLNTANDTLYPNAVRSGGGEMPTLTFAATDPGSDTVTFFVDGSPVDVALQTGAGTTRTGSTVVGPFAGIGTNPTFTATARDDDQPLTDNNSLSQTVNVVGPIFAYEINDFDSSPRSGTPQPDGTNNMGNVVTTGATIDIGIVDFVNGPDMSQASLSLSNVFGTDMGALTDLEILDVLISGSDSTLFSIYHSDGVTPFDPATNGAEVLLAGGADLDLVIEVMTDGTSLGRDFNATLTFLTDQGAANGGNGADFQFALFAVQTPEPTAMAIWTLLGMMIGGYAWRNRVGRSHG